MDDGFWHGLAWWCWPWVMGFGHGYGWCWVYFFFFFLFLVMVGLISVGVVGFVIDGGGGGD